MSFALHPPGAGPVGPGATSAPAATTRPAVEPQRSFAAAAPSPIQNTSSSPAATVQADVAKAARRYEELRQMGRELHFRVEDGGQVVIDVCTLDGRVVRTVPPSEGMAIVTGAAPDGGSRR
ncbi:MAG: hypothetical protein KY463_13985 [Actinobacteria bacterium]|nr:hypothetical protein [Actinomycetota bacterium]